jgi:signal peptide peptidase SppA
MAEDISAKPGPRAQPGPPFPFTLIERVINPPPLVTVVRLAGTIGRVGPVRSGMTLAALERHLEKAFSPRRLNAVALAINSPGGSAVQASLIAARVRALADERGVPVYAFCEDVAASGGYWLACAADEIFADGSSIVGSIGVTSGGFGFVGLMDKLGVERRLHTAGKRKGMLDPFQAEKRDDVRHLAKLQKDIHREFKDWVRTRRGGKLAEDAPELFEGAFWTGRMAAEMGLVDGLGSLHGVMRERFGDTVRLVTVNRRRAWMRRLFPFSRSSVFDAEAGYGLAAEAIAAIEDRAMWNRFGL